MYCAIVGDIILSQSLDPVKRSASTEAINQVLERINEKYADIILASFGIVRGDAFEGVLFSQQYAPQIIQDIIKSLYQEQVKVRLSAVTDNLSVVSSERNQADGQAFYTATQKIDELRKNKSDHWFQVSMVTNSIAQPLVDGLLQLIAALTNEWTEKQTQIVWSMMDCANKQSLVSEKLNISPSVVHKQLKSAQYEAYQKAWSGLEQYLINQEEASITPQKTAPSYTTYYSIANRKSKQGKHAAAVDDFLESLELAKKEFGENSPNLVPIYNGLAGAYLDQLPYISISANEKNDIRDKASEAINASLACQETLPKTRLDYARTLLLQGVYLRAITKYEQALECYDNAIQIMTDRYGAEHPLIFACYHNIAIVHADQGNYEVALDYYRKRLEYAQRNKEHAPMDYAKTLYNIGLLYEKMNRNEEALATLQQALEIYSPILSAKHEYIALTQKSMKRITAKK